MSEQTTLEKIVDRVLELDSKATAGTWYAKMDGWTVRAHIGGPGFDDGTKAASGYMPPELLEGPTRPPKKEPDASDLERIAKAQEKRERKARRGW